MESIVSLKNILSEAKIVDSYLFGIKLKKLKSNKYPVYSYK